MKKVVSFLSVSIVALGIGGSLLVANPTEANAWGMAPNPGVVANPYIPSVPTTTEVHMFYGSYPEYIVSGNNTVLYLTRVIRASPVNFICYYKSAPNLPPEPGKP